MEKKINYYMVNVENCKNLDPVFDGIKEFMVMDGQYEYEFDIVEDELPPDICNKFRYECKYTVKCGQDMGDQELVNADYRPIGFDFSGMPEGATISKLTENKKTGPQAE